MLFIVCCGVGNECLSALCIGSGNYRVCVCLWTTIYYIGVNGRPVRADAPVSDQRATNRLRFYV